ncbi:MAG: hypothetical protein HW380_3821, partial [Magnetococcales bacterium]|nr:hypothetical protein [Magnetococcales bacterium]
ALNDEQRSQATWVGLLLMGVVGVINTARHWDMFLGTFPHFFSIQGWLWTSGAILGAKLVHEFGHAATAYRWGCRVPSMGVAFMLFWPVFYSDVGEAWLLRSRKGRLQIGAGGVVAELGLAALALFFWPFLPDGPARSAMVLLAGVVWVGTVAINLNPFMRFDGYFLLADALGVPNLQQQAFALGQWHLREWLFAWGVPQPQGVEGRLRGGLTVFAYAIWIYRAIFYTAFALLVYFLLFKVAGLLMLIAEVGWFVLRPVALEMGVWWRNRRLFHWNWRLAVTLPVLIGILVLLTLFPWQGSVIAPAMARAGWYQPMFAPVPAQLLHLGVKPDQEVVFRQELMVFQAPDLELSLEQNRIKTTRLRWQLDHEAGQLIPGDNPLVLRRELAAALSEREGLLQEQTLLRVQAPFAGRIKLLAEGLQPGVWVSREQPLVAVMRPQPVRVEAFVSEEEIGRLSGDSMAIFVPADLQLPSRPLKVERIENQAIEFISDVALASTFGGPLAARQDRSGRLVSEKACFRVWLIPESPWPDLDRVIPGSVKFSVAPRTIPELLWHPVWAALIRQTDF